MAAETPGTRRGSPGVPAGAAGFAAVAGRVLWRASPLVAAAAAGVGMASWGASAALLTPTKPRMRWHRPLRVVDVDTARGTITLSGPDAAIPGVWGLRWTGGYAQIGPPPPTAYDDSDQPTVMRPLTIVDGSAPPARGSTGHWDPYAWPDHPDALGVPATDVVVPGPVCDLPAWRFDPDPPPESRRGRRDTGASGGDWAIFVHGRKGLRSQALRAVRPVRETGYTCMVVSYRNDGWLPRVGSYGLGSTEWEDLEAAVAYARNEGAERILLVGYSLGGAIVSTFLRRSALRDLVHGVVLDAPVLDWETVLRGLARGVGLPNFLVTTAMATTSLRAGIDFSELNHLAAAAEFTQPTLIFHGSDDEQVPVEASRAFARARDGVTLVEIAGAGHVTAWNHNPDAYEQALSAFLDGLARRGRGRRLRLRHDRVRSARAAERGARRRRDDRPEAHSR